MERNREGDRPARRAVVVAAAGAWLALAGAGPAGAEDTAFGRVLARHVGPGRIDGIELNVVDYAAIAADPDYRRALDDFARARPDELESEDERFAFWVNAYNLLAIKTIVDRHPIDGIKDAGSFLFPVWKKEVGTVAGRPRSLDEIEHGILRAKFSDPRVHFAVVCASVSCPDLRAEPFEAARLDEQLDDQAARFLANRGKGLDPGPDGKTARVSAIFDWFEEDFAPAGGVAAFLRKKADPATRRAISGLDDAGISYLDYDWSLNDRARSAS